jgi:hypothetical protein
VCACYYSKNRCNARYVGALVADVHNILINGGIYGYPSTLSNKEGKLRLLYESAPMAMIIEQAGGAGSTGHKRILDVIPKETHQRCVVLCSFSKNRSVISFLCALLLLFLFQTGCRHFWEALRTSLSLISFTSTTVVQTTMKRMRRTCECSTRDVATTSWMNDDDSTRLSSTLGTDLCHKVPTNIR